MHRDLESVLVSREQIAEKVSDLGRRISEDYQGQDLLVICVLRGAIIFTADLLRQITVSVTFDTIAVSSYGSSTHTSGVVRFQKDLDESVQGKNILIVEDIIDTGLTLNYLVENLRSRGPKSIRICTLLDKPSRRQVDIHPDYVGFQIPDQFAVGYGLDFDQRYRNLPEVGVLRAEAHRSSGH